jgi:hypothetical protein
MNSSIAYEVLLVLKWKGRVSIHYLVSRLSMSEHDESGAPLHFHVREQLNGWYTATVLNSFESFFTLS